MIFLMESSCPMMFETSSSLLSGVFETLKAMVSSGSKVASRSLARSLRQSAAGHGMDSASGSILKFCNSSRDCVSRPMASICSMEIIPAESGVMIGMATVCGVAVGWGCAGYPSADGAAFCAAGAVFSSGRSEVRFSAENARRRICSTSSPSMPSSRALPPSWKLASMKVQPSSIAATPAL